MKAKNEPAKAKRKAKAPRSIADDAVEAKEALRDNTEDNAVTGGAVDGNPENDNESKDVSAVGEAAKAEVSDADGRTIEKIDALILQVERAAQGLPTEANDVSESADIPDGSSDGDVKDAAADAVADVSGDEKPEEKAESEETPVEQTVATESKESTEECPVESTEETGEVITSETNASETDEHLDIPIFELDSLNSEPAAEEKDAEGEQTDDTDGECPTLSELIDREAEVIPFLSLSDGTSEDEPAQSEDEALTEEDATLKEDADDKNDGDEPSTADGTRPEGKQKGGKPRSSDGKRRIDSIFDIVELCVFTLAAVLVVIAFFFRHAIVDGPSMDHTLADGDNLIISDFMYEPRVGDIVVVEDHSIKGPNYPIVKRIIAVGGQLVRIESSGVYVDDKLESFASETATPETFNYIENICIISEKYPENGLAVLSTYEDFVFVPGVFIEFRVPEGEIFLMGDNRDNSTDSRSFGCVGEESIIGKLLLRIYPFNKFGAV